ncbi:MAG: SCP2 sterol-binding domain-containing protein [Leptolyngbya sp.]|nr:SCP2 sterol-binding domain-containing protein [Candidatus Melainabacteria bacterium]
MSGTKTIEELRRRFKPEAARNVTATYLFSISGQDGAMVLTKINDGAVEFEELVEGTDPTGKADCIITVSREDLESILEGRMSAMTAALSGVLSIEGELGLAMQLVPIFFEGLS